MPYNTDKLWSGTLTEAVEGIRGYDIPGGSGICTVCTMVWNYTAVHPEHAGYTVSITGYPGNVFDDGVGEAGALRTFFQDETDTNLWTPGPIDTEAEGGWLGLTYHMDISVIGIPPEPDNGVAQITLNMTMLDSTVPEDFPGTEPLDPPNNGDAPTIDDTDPNKPILEFTAATTDPIVIERSKVGGEFPWDIAGTIDKPTVGGNTFQDNLTDNGFDVAPGTFKYRLRTYTLDDPSGPSLSEPTDETPTITYPESSTELNYVGTLTLDLDWISIMTFITDPSGIYTLVAGQAYDRLYNRGGEAYVDVKIPNPTARTSEV